MKTMTCRQLGGACETRFQAESFEEMGELSKKHAMEMFNRGDEGHLKAAQKMKQLMQDPGAMNDWFDSRRKEFDRLPDD